MSDGRGAAFRRAARTSHSLLTHTGPLPLRPASDRTSHPHRHRTREAGLPTQRHGELPPLRPAFPRPRRAVHRGRAHASHPRENPRQARAHPGDRPASLPGVCYLPRLAPPHALRARALSGLLRWAEARLLPSTFPLEGPPVACQASSRRPHHWIVFTDTDRRVAGPEHIRPSALRIMVLTRLRATPAWRSFSTNRRLRYDETIAQGFGSLISEYLPDDGAGVDGEMLGRMLAQLHAVPPRWSGWPLARTDRQLWRY
jgi:hypothetical protein